MKPERIHYGSDASQFFELWHPEQPGSGSAVFVHGGFWRAKYDLSHANPLCATLATRGIMTANLEYRRVGQPGGGWPSTFEDVVAGFKATSEYFGHAPVLVIAAHEVYIDTGLHGWPKLVELLPNPPDVGIIRGRC